MELKLATYDECYKNTKLFKKFPGGIIDGMYVHYIAGKPYCFMWIRSGELHRLDGPARIFNNLAEWWFLGEQIFTKDQEEFETFIANKIARI